MSRFRLTPQAEADLEAMAEYYRDKSPAAGDRVAVAIEQRCRRAAAHPLMGTPREELGAGVRTSPVAPYLIFYRPEPGGVQVLRVVHGARDIDPPMFDL